VTLGLAATTSSQIDQRFSKLAATEVDVTDLGPGDPNDTSISFSDDSDQIVEALHGVVHAGIWWPITINSPLIARYPSIYADNVGENVNIIAADPAALAAMGATVSTGRLYNTFHEARAEQVAVLGSTAANILGITRVESSPAIFVNGRALTVVGILSGAPRNPSLLSSIIIPDSTATSSFGNPSDQRAKMFVQTTLGAAPLISRQIALALRPDAPSLFKVATPPDSVALRNGVGHDIDSLVLGLAAISLFIGAAGIANTSLVAVLERTNEIGLRRALGARPKHIAFQFLFESTTVGVLGGLVGASLGVLIVLSVAISHSWTAVVPLWSIPIAPLLGGLVGLAAGVYPATRSALIEPVVALRR
jgi:putative ABC transport system permease protein